MMGPGGSAMIDDVLAELKKGIENAKDALKRDLAKLRTGRAHPGMLDSIRVDYYGQTTPLAQMSGINVREPRMVTVKAWSKRQVQDVGNAVRESEAGVGRRLEGGGIRVAVAALSEGRGRVGVRVAK